MRIEQAPGGLPALI